MELIEIIIGKYDGETDVRINRQHESGTDAVYFLEFGYVFGSLVNIVETLAYGIGFIHKFILGYLVIITVY
jgi:hypothetical protein